MDSLKAFLSAVAQASPAPTAEMRIFFRILDEFSTVSKLPPLSFIWKTGVFSMAITCLFVSAYTKMMNVTTNGAESWVKVAQEMQWRCKKWQGPKAAFHCGLEPSLATCRLFPALSLAHCLIHNKVCHLSYLSSCPHLTQLCCKSPESHTDHIKLWELCPGWCLLVSWWEGRWPQQQAEVRRGSKPLCDAHRPRTPSGKMLCPALRLMYSQTSQTAGAELSLCPHGGMGGKWLLAGFTVLTNPLLTDFQTDERGGPAAETCCRLAVLGTDSYLSSLVAIPYVWSPQVSKFQCSNPKTRKF